MVDRLHDRIHGAAPRVPRMWTDVRHGYSGIVPLVDDFHSVWQLGLAPAVRLHLAVASALQVVVDEAGRNTSGQPVVCCASKTKWLERRTARGVAQ